MFQLIAYDVPGVRNKDIYMYIKIIRERDMLAVQHLDIPILFDTSLPSIPRPVSSPATPPPLPCIYVSLPVASFRLPPLSPIFAPPSHRSLSVAFHKILAITLLAREPKLLGHQYSDGDS